MKVVKRVIVGVLVAALAAGGIYTGLMHVKESKVTEVPVTSVSNLQTDWYSETTLDGTITTNVSQNVNMDKDMIIEKIYVSQGDDVKKGDNNRKNKSYNQILDQIENSYRPYFS